MGEISDQNVENNEKSPNSMQISCSLVNKKVINKKVFTSSKFKNHISSSFASKMNIDKNIEINFTALSHEVQSFINMFKPITRATELNRLRRLNSAEKYEHEIRSLVAFQKFLKNFNSRKTA